MIQQGQKDSQGPKADSLWDKRCKGEGSDPHKKQLMAIFLKTRGKLAKGNMYAKELLEISEDHWSTGVLVVFVRSSIFGCVSSCHS